MFCLAECVAFTYATTAICKNELYSTINFWEEKKYENHLKANKLLIFTLTHRINTHKEQTSWGYTSSFSFFVNIQFKASHQQLALSDH